MPINHLVQQGDSIISLSQAYGLFADTIWDDAANAALRQRRADMNTLLPGDTVVIPDKKLRSEKRATGATHTFRRKGIPALLRLQVFDMHIPRANQPYVLTIDGVPIEGQSDGQGIVEQHISALAKAGELVIGEDQLRLVLNFGHLNPLEDLSGQQQRLNNLGYHCGEADGELNEDTRRALRRFQREHGLAESGEADAQTRDKLQQIHDAPNTYAPSSSAS